MIIGMDERDRWRAFSHDELMVLRCGMMMLKAQPDSPAARAVEQMMSESVVALCDQGTVAEGHEKANTSLPNAPARLLATDLEPRTVAEVMDTEPGPSQYDPRPGLRDVGVSLGPYALAHSHPELDCAVEHYLELDVVEPQRDDAFSLGKTVNLVLLWQRPADKRVYGVLFLGARVVGGATENPDVDVVRVRWRYERTEELT
jgi:hypothetical protein